MTNETYNDISKGATTIDWSLPPLRSGFRGLLDQAFGPGYTKAELRIQTLAPALAALSVPVIVAMAHVPWTIAQQTVAALLALDGLGGVITNSTSSGKRWFHRQTVRPRQHLMFASSHLAHFALVAWFFADSNLLWFFGAAAYLLCAAPLVIFSPIHVQRAVSAALVAIGITYSLLVLPQVPGMQWVLPVFYMKLLGAHLTREEPYR